ncbi:MAG: bifunctional folylpolyglutamate synthase/dihydrofolate synthase [Lachnospiraceae bacterium]|nr:bifunctional folylpolyglutamate synthase/dihydrofolate synthase [Lachnospiraceae bacterium]
MKYDEAIEYMESLQVRGIHPGLEGIKGLCDALGNPEKDLKVIQVVGTNGKGSVSRFLFNILCSAGYRVGLYTSPKVFEEREIIRVNGRNISAADYADLTERIGKINTCGATRFETETAMALLYFREKKCDLVILEAGLGGKLDSTNISSTNVLSVITPIGFDHMGILGPTIRDIAANKAGVIKPGSRCVSAFQVKDAETVIRKTCEDLKVPVTFVDPSSIKASFSLKGTTFSYKSFKKVKTVLLGNYQPENAALSMEAALALREEGFKISDRDICDGILKTTESGRFEKIGDRPLFFIDGAHNEPAAVRLKECIETYFTNREIVIIMGMFKDKDCERVAELIAPCARALVTVASPNRERTLSAFEMAETVKKYNTNVSAADSPEEAVELAYLMAGNSGVILACGSLSILAGIKAAAAGFKNKKDFHGVRFNDR